MDPRIENELKRVRSRLQKRRWWQCVFYTAVVLLALLVAIWYSASRAGEYGDNQNLWSRVATDIWRWLAIDSAWHALIASVCLTGISVIAATSVVFVFGRSNFSTGELRNVAKTVEQHFPSLGQLLLSALDVRTNEQGEYDFLQQRVIRSALHHAETAPWTEAVSTRSLRLWRWGTVAIFTTGLFLNLSLANGSVRRSRPADPSLPALADAGVEVEPGNIEVERGSSLVVTAKLSVTEGSQPLVVALKTASSQQAAPSQTALDGSTATDGPVEKVISMKRNLEDLVYAGLLANIQTDLRYQVAVNGQSGTTYEIKVFDYPAIVRSDALIQPPSYSGLPEKEIIDTRRVTVAEGTRLTWTLQVNKPLQQVVLTDDQQNEIELAASPEDPLRYQSEHYLDRSVRWKLKLVDAAGRQNKLAVDLSARVTPNKSAELKLISAADREVSALEEFPVAVSVRDDYGVKRAGLSYSLGGLPPVEVSMLDTSQTEVSKGLRELQHLVDLEALQAEADQLLSYYFWAEDIGPDGNPRRTMSDIFFAEVRPFEQIFREGTPPPANSPSQSQSPAEQQNAQQADQLIEIQKQIVAALWNLIRQADLAGSANETALAPAMIESANVIHASQQAALEQLATLAENLSTDRSPELVASARSQMESVLREIDKATGDMNRLPLNDAMSSAKSAYETLLRLRAREFDVARSQRQQQNSSSQSSSRSQMQRQLDQLELNNDENRYETQQQPQAPSEDPAAQQTQDALSRLRDLARRQSDLNEQLKQLELALQMAKSEEEEEAAKRQLQRLREQQEDLLRDADELASEMKENAENEALQQASEQLNETRQNLREASEALDRQQPAEALASGSRAERSLQSTEEELRQSSTESLREQVQQLQNKADQLAEAQRRIEEGMRAEREGTNSQGGLRSDENGRDQLAQSLDAQAEVAEELLEQTRETIRQAEEDQPRLASELYEAQQQLQQSQVGEELKLSAELLRRGYDPQAESASQSAREKIEQFQRSMRDATGELLEDPVEGLQRANSQLANAEQQLQSERPESAEGESSSPAPAGNEGQPAGQQPDSPPQESTEPNQEGEQPGSGRSSTPNSEPQEGSSGLIDALWAEIEGSSEEGGNPGSRPITGDGFRQWSEQLRQAEDLLTDPQMRSRLAGIRDRAREMRREMTRHAKEPQWSEIEAVLSKPLRELQRDVTAELLRRSAERNAIVPIEREPVPGRYESAVQKYYEQLGAGQ